MHNDNKSKGDKCAFANAQNQECLLQVLHTMLMATIQLDKELLLEFSKILLTNEL